MMYDSPSTVSVERLRNESGCVIGDTLATSPSGAGRIGCDRLDVER